MQLKLYSYWRSSSSYRVRIALNIKEIKYEIIPVNLLKNENTAEEYRRLNPQGLVPTLVVGGNQILTQSLAIIEYLEEIKPVPPLLPADSWARAKIRQIAQLISSDIHPLNNLGPLSYLTEKLGVTEEQKQKWYHYWVHQGFNAIEQLLMQLKSEDFCYGNQPSIADICLIPQVYNAERFKVDLKPYPAIRRIAKHCNELPAFKAAHPSAQPDAAIAAPQAG
ncbi:MAG: maleylacetoacetate isomerase [Dongiaceae bacterium]